MEKSKSDTLYRLTEFSKHLYYSLYPPLYKGIKQIWDASKKEAKPGHVYETFQEHLKNIPKWNQDLIDKVYQRITQNIRFENTTTPEATAKFLDDLITKVFLLTTEMLAAPSGGEKIMVKVPPGSKFVHHCYKECARQFYGCAFLMEDRPQLINSLKKLENMRECNELIIRCIENAVRRLLPLDSLLEQKPTTYPVLEEERPQSPENRASSRSRSRTSRSRSRAGSPPVYNPNPTAQVPNSDLDDLFEAESDIATDEPQANVTPIRGRSPAPSIKEATNPMDEDDTMTVRFNQKTKRVTRDPGTYPESSEEFDGFNIPKSKKASSVIDSNDLPEITKKEESTFDFSKQENGPSLDKDFDALNFFDDA